MNAYSRVEAEVTDRGGYLSIPADEWDKVEISNRGDFLRSHGVPLNPDNTWPENIAHEMEMRRQVNKPFNKVCWVYRWWAD